MQTIGTVVGESILQDKLLRSLPITVLSSIPDKDSSSLALSAIQIIPQLPPGTQLEVRRVFANACRTVWIALIPIAILGLLTCAGLKSYKLPEESDEEYAMQ